MSASQERRVFAPRPQAITIAVGDQQIDTELYHFLDLRPKAALEVYELETGMAGQPVAAVLRMQREIVALLCPSLPAEAVADLPPGLCQDLINESHELRGRPPVAEEAPASPSASPASSSASPSAPAGPTGT